MLRRELYRACLGKRFCRTTDKNKQLTNKFTLFSCGCLNKNGFYKPLNINKLNLKAMLQKLKAKQPHADYSTSAMETETIQKNEASPKSLMSRRNFLNTFIRVVCLSFLAINLISASCRKDPDDDKYNDPDSNSSGVVYYYSDNIEDVIKIKELLADSDCDKGILIKNAITTSSGTYYESNVVYCDYWNTYTANIDRLYSDFGNISYVEYNRRSKTVVIESKSSSRESHTISFYTKSNH